MVDTRASNTKDARTTRSKGGSAPSTTLVEAKKVTPATKMGATTAKAAPATKKAVAMKKTATITKKTAAQAMKKVAAMKTQVAPPPVKPQKGSKAAAAKKPAYNGPNDKRSHQKYVPPLNITIYLCTTKFFLSHRKASVQRVQNDAAAEKPTEKEKTRYVVDSAIIIH